MVKPVFILFVAIAMAASASGSAHLVKKVILLKAPIVHSIGAKANAIADAVKAPFIKAHSILHAKGAALVELTKKSPFAHKFHKFSKFHDLKTLVPDIKSFNFAPALGLAAAPIFAAGQNLPGPAEIGSSLLGTLTNNPIIRYIQGTFPIGRPVVQEPEYQFVPSLGLPQYQFTNSAPSGVIDVAYPAPFRTVPSHEFKSESANH